MNLYSEFTKALLNYDTEILLTEHNGYRFKDIDTFTAKIANYYFNLGVKPGDRIAVQINKSEYALFIYLACLRSGIIYLPLNNTYSAEELSYFFNDAQPSLIICDPADADQMRRIKHSEICIIETLDERGNGTLQDKVNSIVNQEHQIYEALPDTVAVIIYTSGTTGKPKGAMITHNGLFKNAIDLITVWGITGSDTALHMLPLFHVHGLFFAVHTALLTKARIILLPKFDVNLFFHYLPKSTVFMGVPTHYIRLLKEEGLTHNNCKHMRLFISGSAPLLLTTFNEFKNKTGHTLLERYGMTETGINSSNPLNAIRKIGTVGLPLPSVTIRITDDNNVPLSVNRIGNIQIKGENLFLGYWRNPEKTKEEFTEDGYFKTGDLGTIDNQGYLSIVGRSKDLVITGGLNVYPKEIELTIDTLDGVDESAVVGVPHPDFGEAVIAVVATSGQTKIGELTIIENIKKHHAGYKCPKKIFFVDKLPKNTMGKVQKNILRERFADIFV